VGGAGGSAVGAAVAVKAWDEDPTNPVAEANEVEVVTWNPPLGKGRKFGLVKRADVVVSSEEQAA
jgi:hypothetical protein